MPPGGVGAAIGSAGSWTCRVVPWPDGLRTKSSAAEGPDPVSETDDAGATARVGATYAVVADREGEGTVTSVHAQVDDRGLCVLGGILGQHTPSLFRPGRAAAGLSRDRADDDRHR